MVNETAFSFEISEILYLQESHALKEMIELSLEPNVNIKQINEEVNLEGNLRLVGKYIKSNEKLERNEPDYDPRKVLENVNERIDHSEFTHEFPVNIFVPANRLDEGAKTEVTIAAFDYEIINPLALRFFATVEISGFLPEEKMRDREREVETDISLEGAPREEVILEDQQLREAEQKNNEIPIKKDKEENNPKDIGKDKKKESQDLKVRVQEETALEEINKIQDTNDVKALDEDISSSENEINYLTNMFDHDEENQVRLQICIVQEEDTLDTISEKFSIKKSQLMKQNNLVDETIKSGEILFISLH